MARPGMIDASNNGQAGQAGKTTFAFPFTLSYSAVMCGGFQGGPQLDPPDVERRQSLGQLYV